MSENISACHCSICTKWVGGPFMEVECGTNITFQGIENISIFNSSEWAERGFCSICGTHLFIRSKTNNKIGISEGYGIPVGLFEETNKLVFNLQVFIDEKLLYYSFSEKTKNISSADIYEKYPGIMKNNKK